MKKNFHQLPHVSHQLFSNFFKVPIPTCQLRKLEFYQVIICLEEKILQMFVATSESELKVRCRKIKKKKLKQVGFESAPRKFTEKRLLATQCCGKGVQFKWRFISTEGVPHYSCLYLQVHNFVFQAIPLLWLVLV